MAHHTRDPVRVAVTAQHSMGSYEGHGHCESNAVEFVAGGGEYQCQAMLVRVPSTAAKPAYARRR